MAKEFHLHDLGSERAKRRKAMETFHSSQHTSPAIDVVSGQNAERQWRPTIDLTASGCLRSGSERAKRRKAMETRGVTDCTAFVPGSERAKRRKAMETKTW